MSEKVYRLSLRAGTSARAGQLVGSSFTFILQAAHNDKGVNMPDVAEKQFELEQHISALTDERFVEAIQYAEKCVRAMRPDAKLMFTADRRGAISHVGIYDVKLFLNMRGQFAPIEQSAPQLLSEYMEYRESYPERAQLRVQFNVWADAYTKLVALNGVK